MKKMKSVILEHPNKLVLKDCPVPQPGPSEVLIRVKSAAICHTDFFTMRGDYPGCKYPTVLGHEFSGIVQQCGPGVTNVSPDDPVTCLSFAFCGTCQYCRRGLENGCENVRAIPFHIDGAYQEMLCMPAASAFKFDETLSFNEASLTEPAANAYSAVDRGDIKVGEHVVVIGPGPIGLLCVQFAKLKTPSTLTLLGTRDERLQIGEKTGATDTVHVRQTDPYEAIMNITDGHGADVVILCAGTENAWELSGRILAAKYGRVIIEALPDTGDTKWPVSVFDFTAKHISYLGVSGYTAAQFGDALQLMQAKKVDVAPLITHTFRLQDYADAFEASDKRKDGAVKVVIEIDKQI